MAPIRFAVVLSSAGPQAGALEPWQLDCLTPLSGLECVIPVARIVTSTSGPPADSGNPLPAQWLELPLVALDQPGAQTQLQALDLDFILTWSDETALRTVADVARHGLWRFQLGDWEQLRGEPAGFWEVYERRTVSSAALVRVLSDSDSFIVLRQAHVRTQLHSWGRNRSELMRRCADWAAQLCTDIRNGEVRQFSAAPARCATRRRAPPSAWHSLVYAIRIATRLAFTTASEFLRHEQWNVGVIDQPISALLTGAGAGSAKRPPTRWLTTPKPFEFLADPFGVVRDGQLTVLCEYLSYHDNRGTIVSIDAAGRTAAVHIGPQPPVHLSYPCLIELDGRLLCIPETHEAHEVALYELERFPDRWRKVATLLSATAAVDATPFRHEGRWWLAASMPAAKGANCELHLWYSSDIAGPWQAHPGNPVKIDVRSARPGGTPFVHAGVLYRPAQDCSTAYGARAIINRVLTLTPTAFREEFAAAVDPDPASPYPDGLHTVSAVGDITLIDAKRLHFVPAQFQRVLAGALRAVRKRLS